MCRVWTRLGFRVQPLLSCLKQMRKASDPHVRRRASKGFLNYRSAAPPRKCWLHRMRCSFVQVAISGPWQAESHASKPCALTDTRNSRHPAPKAPQKKPRSWQDDVVSGISSSKMSTQDDADAAMDSTFSTGNTTQATHEVAEEPLIRVDEELGAQGQGETARAGPGSDHDMNPRPLPARDYPAGASSEEMALLLVRASSLQRVRAGRCNRKATLFKGMSSS